MSEYVVHLTDRVNIVDVLGAGTVEARMATGVVRNRSELGDSQKSVCLSEIPLWHLDRLADRHSYYGVAAMTGGIDPTDPLWEITQFYDNPGEYGGTCYEFDWEREWRVPRHLRFTENEVAFLLAREDDHSWMRQTAWGHLAGSTYQGVVLDPRWNIERIQQELIVNGSSLA